MSSEPNRRFLVVPEAGAEAAVVVSATTTADGARNEAGLQIGQPEKVANDAPVGDLDGDGDLDDVDFGTLGIYGDAANGVDNAFEMVGANSNGNSSTNAAGCNTSNRLTLTKTNGTQGLLNADAAAAGYDTNVFQANIPYSLGANYVAGSPGQLGVSPSLGKFTVSTTEASDSRENNAWRSGLGIRVDIPAAAKALVAGTYTDTVTVLIEVI